MISAAVTFLPLSRRLEHRVFNPLSLKEPNEKLELPRALGDLVNHQIPRTVAGLWIDSDAADYHSVTRTARYDTLLPLS